MSEINDKIKEQVEKINDSVEQVVKAGKGLAIKIKEESNKQYNELVELGEKTEDSEEKLISQFREFLETTLKDYKGSSKQVVLAGRGLATRVKDNSESFFNELVELGTTEEAEETAAS